MKKFSCFHTTYSYVSYYYTVLIVCLHSLNGLRFVMDVSCVLCDVGTDVSCVSTYLVGKILYVFLLTYIAFFWVMT